MSLRKYKSLFSTTLQSSIGTGTGDTITLNSAAGLPTDTEITITIDRVDANGTATPSKMERITGTLSGSNLTSYTRGVDGTTEQAHSSGAVIEMVWNAADWNANVDALLEEHNVDGTHSVSKMITEGTVKDEDDMASNSATALATQQSIKAYVDAIDKTKLIDSNDVDTVLTEATASAVNEVTVKNAATSGVPVIKSTGDDTNIHLSLDAKGDAVVKVKVLRRNNGTSAYQNNSIIVTGWGYVAGSASNSINGSVSFGVTFASVPVVVFSSIGVLTTGTPDSIDDFNNNGAAIAESRNISTTGYTQYFYHRDTGSNLSAWNYGFSWIAIGQLN